MPTIVKTVEVHHLQFSCQVVDVQLSGNDEFRGDHPDPVHLQKRCRGARTSAYGSVVQEDSGVPNGTEDPRFWSSDTRDSGVETPSTTHPDSPEVFECAHRVSSFCQRRKPKKSSSLNVSILNTSRSGHRQHSQQRSMNILRSGRSTDQRVETVDVSMAREVTSFKTTSHRSELE